MIGRATIGLACVAACMVGAAPALAGEPHRDALVNLALDGTPAADGNAGTAWCPAGPRDALNIDLDRPRRLEGFGVSLTGDSAAAQVRIEAERGRRVAADSLPADGTPAWLPLRRELVTRRLRVTAGSACVAELRALGRASRPLVNGHDLSFMVQEAAAGARYTDRGREALPEQILADHGADWARLRLWTDPPPGYSDLDNLLASARRAKRAGLKLLLDPHYSDFWADPQKQPIPAAWEGQDLRTLANTVRTYTRDVLDRLSRQGTPADAIQLGNEIRNGMLWPVGRLFYPQETNWDALGTLLRAAAEGARDARGPTPVRIVHFDWGGFGDNSDNAQHRWFYDHIVAQRVPFDVIGLSYYPFWHGGLDELRFNLGDLSARYRRPVAIVEIQYGWTLANGDRLGNFLWEPSLLLPGYDATPGGQLAFLSDVTSLLHAVPDRRGVGTFYWSPEWIPGVGWAPGEGTPNDNLTLFDFQGRALPAVAFQDPLRACARYAPGRWPCVL